ncbi:MAG: xanthine dehydrogenase accessory protein XdhC [Flexilinea sp.]|nr:xanthine dehydrogenase accessory protein XdhC [Flexilinea sp.]
MRELFAKILYETPKNNDLILVTLTGSDGSAPRKTGSQMLVGKSGRILGTIGGGAVELHSVKMAQRLLEEKRSDLHPFRLHTNNVEDIGMICGGDVTALFQFIPADDPLWKEICGKALELISTQKGGWFVQRLDGGIPSILDEEGTLLAGEKPDVSAPEGNLPVSTGTAFWMPLPVAQRVIIFGGGHISAALVPLLTTVGFRCWVFDNRPEYTTEDRFPQAERLITGDYEHLSDHIEMMAEDYAVIMTNGHSFDLEVQDQILRGPFAYIGVIGSRKKTAAVNAKLRERGISEEAIARVHTPIGTAIKAVTPEEIAVSIAGELILTRAERREAEGISVHGCPMH